MRLEGGNETSGGEHASNAEGERVGGTGVSGCDWAGRGWRGVGTGAGGNDWRVCGGSGVRGWVHWGGVCWGSVSWRRWGALCLVSPVFLEIYAFDQILPGGARGGHGGVDWLGDGARAVGDGQGGGLGDGVGHAVVGDLGGLRAVGGVGLQIEYGQHVLLFRGSASRLKRTVSTSVT